MLRDVENVLRDAEKMLCDAERTFLNVARPARGHNCLANGSKGPLNGSPLQIKVQMLRDRHLVLREPGFVMGGGSKKPRCRLKAWRTQCGR